MSTRFLQSTFLLVALTLVCGVFAGCGEPAEDAPVDEAPQDVETLAAVDGEFMPRFAPAEEGFYRTPWPSDGRLTDEGGVDITDIPNQRHRFVRDYIQMLKRIRGYSTMPVAYIPFATDKPPARGSLPSPAETLEESADVQLIDVSEDGCGRRIPIEVTWDAEGDEFLDAHILKAAPVPGSTLRPSTTYAFVVTTGFGGRGSATGRPQAFADHFNDQGDDDALNRSLDPLRACLPSTGLVAGQIAVASVFTTQDPVEDTRRMRETVWSEETELREITDFEEWTEKSTDAYTVWRGTMQAPIFQAGISPYSKEGGLEFDAEGRAIIQRWEAVPFAITVPNNPGGPLRMLVWEDGTGATIDSHVGDAYVEAALAEGFAVGVFVAQFHQGRENAQSDPTMHTFNYLNPASGRTVFRQQVAETSHFVRLLEETITQRGELPEIDTSRVFYGGHSQGALIGAMVAGVEPRIDTYALNGVGSYLSETVVFRKDPFDIAAMIKNLLGVSRPIDRFHPIVQMAQIGADAVDPHNYVRYWSGWDDADGESVGGASVFLINGKHDETTSTVSMNAMMHTAEVPVVGEAGWDVAPWGVREVEFLEPPVADNRQSTRGRPLTFGAYLSATNGHFTIFHQTEAREAMVNFWATSAAGSAVIDF